MEKKVKNRPRPFDVEEEGTAVCYGGIGDYSVEVSVEFLGGGNKKEMHFFMRELRVPNEQH